jgi:hypothetical protein
MTRTVDACLELDNTVRPHETLAGARPIERYLADPDRPPDDLTASLHRANMHRPLDAGH